MADDQLLSVASGILCEFLEVAIHGILYSREIYPLGAFERKKKYDVPVQICTHPSVATYIDNVISSVKRLLDAGTVQQIVIILIDSEQAQEVEKFVFEVACCSKLSNNLSFDELYVLEQSLRGALLQLYLCQGVLNTLSSGCTWTVEIHTKRSSLLEIRDKQLMDDMKWIMKDKTEQHNLNNNFKIIPLKSISNDCFTMQLFVQDLRSSQ